MSLVSLLLPVKDIRTDSMPEEPGKSSLQDKGAIYTTCRAPREEVDLVNQENGRHSEEAKASSMELGWYPRNRP